MVSVAALTLAAIIVAVLASIALGWSVVALVDWLRPE
jgi:hypothetical protein